MSGPDLAWQLLSNVDSVTGTDGRCISTMGQTALIMVQPVHYTGSFIGGVHNQAPDCTSHTISQSVGCAIVWYNQATMRELLPDTPHNPHFSLRPKFITERALRTQSELSRG
jgi:hypothetical protein